MAIKRVPKLRLKSSRALDDPVQKEIYGQIEEHQDRVARTVNEIAEKTVGSQIERARGPAGTSPPDNSNDIVTTWDPAINLLAIVAPDDPNADVSVPAGWDEGPVRAATRQYRIDGKAPSA
jgi:hypothetical protein